MPPTQQRFAVNARPTVPPTRPTSEPVKAPVTDERRLRVESALGDLAELCRRHGLRALRSSLALVFLWFGALKLIGATPVEGLISATLPFLSTDLTIPALGVVEIVLGLVVVAGRLPRLALLALAAHLTGTFLTFVTAPQLMFAGGNPLLLTAEGEFVLKNLVLISAALVLVGAAGRGTPSAVTRQSGQD